jgi:predicted GNAT family N-acyltransferase
MSTRIAKAENRHYYGLCSAIRAIVFVAEQGYDLSEDFSNDEAWTEYYLLWADDKTPAATARWKMLDEHTARIGAIAVLKEHRGHGHGKALVEHIDDIIAAQPHVKTIQMSEQDYALPFYEKLGYEVVGEGYMDGHIPHHKIIKQVRA